MDRNDESSDPVMSIGTLADKVGLSVSAVRKYENACLILAHRTASGHRLFSREDIERIRIIQRMIQDLGLNIEGIRRLQALLPCWQLLPCNAKQRGACLSYQDNSRPCWIVRGLDCPAAGGDGCRHCVVYRFGSLCTEEIKSLLHEQPDNQGATRAVRTLMDRRRRCREETGGQLT